MAVLASVDSDLDLLRRLVGLGVGLAGCAAGGSLSCALSLL